MSGPRHDPSLFRDRDGIEVARALVSVSDKTGLLELAAALAEAGVEIVSTGSTASTIADAGFPVTPVQDVTGFPEALDGRVKTLHPAVHAGLLADLRLESHEAQLGELGISPFQLVVVNLYPFVETVASGAPSSDVIEQIDIGGPAMVRASAKNHANVAIVVSPSSYDEVIQAVRSGGTTLDQRRRLAAAAFAHTADYDRAVADYFRWTVVGGDASGDAAPGWPASWDVAGELAQVLRYGENSHQDAALYRRPDGAGIAQAVQLHGKEMSYTNFVDADAAVRAAYDFQEPAVAIIKHANPCGIAVAAPRAVDAIAAAHRSAHDCDPVSAFGGVIAANRTVTLGMAETVKEIFTEVLVAPGFDEDALTLLKTKKNLRLLTLPEGYHREGLEARQISGGYLGSPATRSRPTARASRRRGPWRPGNPWTSRRSRTSSSRGRPAGRSSRTRSCSPTTVLPWEWAWGRSTASTPAIWPWSARATAPPGRWPRPTRSSRSPTDCRSCSTPGSARWSSPGDQCATRRSSRPPAPPASPCTSRASATSSTDASLRRSQGAATATSAEAVATRPGCGLFCGGGVVRVMSPLVAGTGGKREASGAVLVVVILVKQKLPWP